MTFSWAEVLLGYVKLKKYDYDFFIETLRYDWGPFSSAQYYPKCIHLNDNDKIKNLRKRVWNSINNFNKEIDKKTFNKSLVFMPNTEKMKFIVQNSIVIFINKGKERDKVSIPIKDFL